MPAQKIFWRSPSQRLSDKLQPVLFFGHEGGALLYLSLHLCVEYTPLIREGRRSITSHSISRGNISLSHLEERKRGIHLASMCPWVVPPYRIVGEDRYPSSDPYAIRNIHPIVGEDTGRSPSPGDIRVLCLLRISSGTPLVSNTPIDSLSYGGGTGRGRYCPLPRRPTPKVR
jgi:hypothetical protein